MEESLITPDYLAVMEAYYIEVCATGAGSPWSNGICEWNHQVVDVMVQKIQEDFPKMDINLILSNAVSAKNCLQNHNGFTPVHHNLPSVLKNDLPVLEEDEENSTCKKHLDAMFAARSAYMRAENSERIKRALRHPVRSTEKFFEKGEKVMFKRDDNNRWKGPALVVGQSGTVCYVKYEARLIKVPICRLVNMTVTGREDDKPTNSGDEVGIDDDELQKMMEGSEQEEMPEDSGRKEVNEDNIEVNGPMQEMRKRNRKKKKSYIPEEGTWKNIKLQNKIEEVNVVFIPKERHSEPEVVRAKLAVIDNWIKMGAVDVVVDQKPMSTRWVITEKKDNQRKMVPKARFVLRGSKEAGGQVKSDAPTAAKSSLRSALASR